MSVSKNQLTSHITKLINKLEKSRAKEYENISKECDENSMMFELRMDQARTFYDEQIAELNDELRIVNLASLETVGA